MKKPKIIRCPYCGGTAILRDASFVYGTHSHIKYIQSLLGHVDPRSTDVYLHVSNKTLLGIRSPFDNPEGGES